MRHGLLALALMGGGVCLVGCDQQTAKHSASHADDSPVLGTWAIESAGDSLGHSANARFEFQPYGRGYFLRDEAGSDNPHRYDLTYTFVGNMISIHSEGEAQDLPRLVGKVTLNEKDNTLLITTQADERWQLVRTETVKNAQSAPVATSPAQENQDNAGKQVDQVSLLLEACSRYAASQGRKPERVMDLVNAGVVSPQQLVAIGGTPLPSGFGRMNEWEQAQWLKDNAGYAFFFGYVGTGQASSIVVTSLPSESDTQVYIGMADGTVYIKDKAEVEMLLDLQLGMLPERWPAGGSSGGIASGLDASAQ